MKFLYFPVVVLICLLLAASLVFLDDGEIKKSVLCILFALAGFMSAYRIQAQYLLLDDV